MLTKYLQTYPYFDFFFSTEETGKFEKDHS